MNNWNKLCIFALLFNIIIEIVVKKYKPSTINYTLKINII